MFFGTVSGGLSAELTGGSFWAGARQGLITSGLNYITTSSFEKKSEYANGGKKKTNNAVTKSDNIILFDPDENPVLYGYAMEQPVEEGVVKVFSHGNTKEINGNKTPEGISQMMYENSPTWKSFIDNGAKAKLIVEFHSCKVAMHETAIAYKFSGKFPSVEVRAPSNRLEVTRYSTYKNNIFYGRHWNGYIYKTEIINGGSWQFITGGKNKYLNLKD